MAITKASQSCSSQSALHPYHWSSCTVALRLQSRQTNQRFVKPLAVSPVEVARCHVQWSCQHRWRFAFHASSPQWTRHCQWQFAWFMHADYVKKSTMPKLVLKGPYFGNKFIKGTPFGQFASSCCLMTLIINYV